MSNTNTLGHTDPSMWKKRARKDEFFQFCLRSAYSYAAFASEDPRTQNGALLCDPKSEQILLMGANRRMCGMFDTPINPKEELVTGDKADLLVHAERDVLFQAAQRGLSTRGLTLVCPWACCPDCANAIVGCGIRNVVTYNKPISMYKKWETVSEHGLSILFNHGITLYRFDSILPSRPTQFTEITLPNILFDGKPFNPLLGEWE